MTKPIRTSRSIRREYGRAPSNEEIAKKMDFPVSKVRETARVSISFETTIGEGNWKLYGRDYRITSQDFILPETGKPFRFIVNQHLETNETRCFCSTRDLSTTQPHEPHRARTLKSSQTRRQNITKVSVCFVLRDTAPFPSRRFDLCTAFTL